MFPRPGRPPSTLGRHSKAESDSQRFAPRPSQMHQGRTQSRVFAHSLIFVQILSMTSSFSVIVGGPALLVAHVGSCLGRLPPVLWYPTRILRTFEAACIAMPTDLQARMVPKRELCHRHPNSPAAALDSRGRRGFQQRNRRLPLPQNQFSIAEKAVTLAGHRRHFANVPHPIYCGWKRSPPEPWQLGFLRKPTSRIARTNPLFTVLPATDAGTAAPPCGNESSAAGSECFTMLARWQAKRGHPRPKNTREGSLLVLKSPRVVVRAGGLEPPRPVRVCGFSYHFGFRRPAETGSWSGLSLHPSPSEVQVLPV